jgi:uncharacterized protein (TIGR03000 family)
MRSVGVSLALGVAPLLLGVAPSEALAQRAMMAPARPVMSPFVPGTMSPFVPGFGMSQLRMVSPASAYMMPYGGYGMYAMPYGGYGSMSYGGYGGGGGYGSSYGGYGSFSPSSPAVRQASQLKATAAAEVEVSGPLDTPPPRRAVIRVRLPRSPADVSFDGQKVDTIGRSRTYVTPELTGSRTFEVAATWTHNGRTSRVQEQVTVKAGQVRTLDFTSGK